MWPWILGGAIILIAAATSDNKKSTYASEYRAAKRRSDSEKTIKIMLNDHHEKASKRQLQLRKAENRLLEEKNLHDHKNLEALKLRMASTESKSERKLLSKQIKFYKNEIRKNSHLIASNRKLLNA